MRKIFLTILLFFALTKSFSQKVESPTSQPQNYLTPNGIFDNLFDNYGNKYQIADLEIAKDSKNKKGNTLKNIQISCSSGYFNLYFETGSGMEIVGNPVHDSRRSVICKVFEDLSNFINSPLSVNGNKVNIWIRDINNVIPDANGVLGLASPFYSIPYNTSSGFGGIIDNEIWKTIQTGVDSYSNVTYPLNPTGGTGNSGSYYHGIAAFNFNSNNSTSINWHTNLATNASPNLYDLYSVTLHEVTHSLGFASLIDGNGNSKLPEGYNYYTRYDSFLKNSENTQFLLKNDSACSSMYNYTFNNSLNTSILAPNPLGLACNNNTVCGTAIRYAGQLNIPVFTPNCFSSASSLSHFEDLCITPPYNNNSYFAMSDAIGTGITKRFLKIEERSVLCDLGYVVNNSYGSTVASGTINYGSNSCTGISVAGLNDGFNTDGTFSYIGAVGTPISISGILANDVNATNFECLQDVFSTSNLSITSGNSTSVINFNSTVSGLHLLRYVPISATEKTGNITYIYVYVTVTNNCSIPSICNLVSNGDFEQHSSISDLFYGEVYKACGWIRVNQSSTDYLHTQGPVPGVRVPCNNFGVQSDNVPSNMGYVHFVSTIYNAGNPSSNNFEMFATKLASPLLPNTEYQLSFDASSTEGNSRFRLKMQAYLSVNLSVAVLNTFIPISNSEMLFTNPTFTNISNGWERITFKIPAREVAGEEYLYLGNLSNTLGGLVPANSDPSCNYYPLGNHDGTQYRSSGYYIDNVELIPLNGARMSLPETICLNQLIPNLSAYISSVPSNGIFSGSGVTVNSGIYSFTPTTSGVTTVTYTYTNNSGCSISISDTINVLLANGPNCDGSTNCSVDLTFSTTETASSIEHEASNSITTNGNYVVNANSDVTLKAGSEIVIANSSHIKANSIFLAKIEDCSNSQRIVENLEKNISSEKKLLVYPNPTNSTINIQATNSTIAEIIVNSIDGKLIDRKTTQEVNFYQMDLSKCMKGIYLVIVKTSDGNIHVSKIAKQ